MSAENGRNHDRETIESNAKEMFGTSMNLLREGRRIRILRFWKYRQFDCLLNYEGQLVTVRIRADEELDKASSIAVNITGKHKESLRVSKVEVGSRETYRVYGGNALDPAGSTLSDNFRDLERIKKGLNVLFAIKLGIDAEKTAQRLAFGEKPDVGNT